MPPTPKSDPREGELGLPWALQVAQTIADLQGFKFLRGASPTQPWPLSDGGDPMSLLPCPRTKTNAALRHEYRLPLLHLLQNASC